MTPDPAAIDPTPCPPGLPASGRRLWDAAERDAAGAAALRQAFYAATAEFWDGTGKTGLPKDHPAIAIWGRLYEAVRDSGAGLRLWSNLLAMESRAKLAEVMVLRLHAAIMAALPYIEAPHARATLRRAVEETTTNAEDRQ